MSNFSLFEEEQEFLWNDKIYKVNNQFVVFLYILKCDRDIKKCKTEKEVEEIFYSMLDKLVNSEFVKELKKENLDLEDLGYIVATVSNMQEEEQEKGEEQTISQDEIRGYDILDDLGLIVSSFQEQYHINLYKDKLSKSNGFCLISGLSSDTALGKEVQIRTEEDKEVIKKWPDALKMKRLNWIEKERGRIEEEHKNDKKWQERINKEFAMKVSSNKYFSSVDKHKG